MEIVLTEFASFIVSEKSRLYDVPGDQRVLRLELLFIDLSRLIVHEIFFYDTGREKYSYQWMTATNDFIHRWDNAHPVPVETSPHHQHIGSEENVQPSEPMTLEKVLAFIASQLT